MAYFRCGGGGKTSLILPTNPTISLDGGDKTIKVTLTQPATEIAVDHYNIYTSTSNPSKLEDMNKVGETTSLTYSITGLTNNTKYYVVATSVDADGYENASISKIKNATPSALVIVIGKSSKATPQYSTDEGLTFTNATGITRMDYVAYNGTKYVGLDSGNKKLYSSTNGKTWSQINATINIYNSLLNICYGNGVFVIPDYSSSTAYVHWSTDGITWNRVNISGGGYSAPLTFCNGTFVLVSDVYVFTSTDGKTWTQKYANSSYYYNGKTFIINNYFYGIGRNSSGSQYNLFIKAPVGGSSYSSVKNVGAGSPTDLIYYKGVFVMAITNSGTTSSTGLYYSTDMGVTWTYTGENTIPYGGIFVVAGDNLLLVTPSKVFKSTDGITWTVLSTFSTSAQSSCATTNRLP